MRKFRFEDLENRTWYRFAKQFRDALLSISNYISEGPGSTSRPDFTRFLNYSKPSVYEVVNMLFVLRRRRILT